MSIKIIKERKIIENRWPLDLMLSPRPDEIGRLIEQHQKAIFSLKDWGHLISDKNVTAAEIGVLLAPDDDVSVLAAGLEDIPIVLLDFSNFSEGRGYSQAVKLRQYGYSGEIRAIGAYLDNLYLMERCGINAFELADTENLDEAIAYFDEVSEFTYH